MITVVVPGAPVGQGSKSIIGGRLLDANAARLRPWRATVAAHLADQLAAMPAWNPDGPMRVELAAVYARPAAHLGARGLRPSAPRLWKTTSPDLDKVARAALDACTDAGVWRDDRQVAALTCRKTWSDGGSRLHLTITRIDDAPRSTP